MLEGTGKAVPLLCSKSHISSVLCHCCQEWHLGENGNCYPPDGRHWHGSETSWAGYTPETSAPWALSNLLLSLCKQPQYKNYQSFMFAFSMTLAGLISSLLLLLLEETAKKNQTNPSPPKTTNKTKHKKNLIKMKTPLKKPPTLLHSS